MKRIIVTDDDEGIRDIFKMIFERAGYNVQVFDEASAILENNFTVPDLFLLDRQLSGYDGLEICKFLKNQNATKNVPVIIVSASSEIHELARKAGADDFIEKPFQIKELLGVVERWI